MSRYRAQPGQEDRHGEMTGAISINMMLSMLPVTIWAVFVGPLVCSFRATLLIALAMGIVLPLAFLPLSRRIWAWVSEFMDA